MILNYNSTTYQLVTKTTENGETWVVGDTGVKTLKIYFTGITAVNVDNYECIAIMERADGTLSNNILATPVSTGYYKIITNEWICGIEGTLEITVKLRQSDGVGGYNTTTFGLATIDIAEGNLPGDDTITDAQYQALLTALNTASADGVTNLNYELEIASMVLTDIDQVITEGAYQFFYHDVGDTFDKKALMIISERDGDFLDETLYIDNAICVRTYDVGNETWGAWTKFVVSIYKAYIDGLLAGTRGVDAIKYDTATPKTTLSIGETRWNDEVKTIETKLSASVTLQHGQELLVRVFNNTGNAIPNGKAVYISGAPGSSPITYITLASNVNYLDSSRTIGLTTETIADQAYGFVCIIGVVNDIDTSAFNVGDLLYLGSAGALTSTIPTPPSIRVAIGIVLQKHSSTGRVIIKPLMLFRPEDLSNISLVGSLTQGDVFMRNGGGNWQNEQVYTKAQADTKFLDVAGDTMVGELAMGSNKITGLADGSSDQDAATIKNLDNHDESETAHLYIRELVQDLENEIARLDGRGKSYGEIPDTTAYLLSLDQATRNGVITGAIVANFGGLGYTPSYGDLVYDLGVGDGVGYHEWEYNGENWVDNGMLGSGKASNDLFGYIKGDGTYLSVVSGLVQVLKSDYAAKLGTSGANYTYTDIYNALADKQDVIDATHKLSADNVDDSATTNKFVTSTEKSTWNGKQNALTAGDGISISGSSVVSATGVITVETWNTATKTLALSDANKLFKCSHTTDQTLTIPTNATVAFPIGTKITFSLTSTYTVTFVGASGVTLTSIDSLVELKTRYSMASLIKLGDDTWQLVGALESGGGGGGADLSTQIITLPFANWTLITDTEDLFYGYYTQAKAVLGVVLESVIWLDSANENYNEYIDAEIKGVEQGLDEITFIAIRNPGIDVNVKVVLA